MFIHYKENESKMFRSVLSLCNLTRLIWQTCSKYGFKRCYSMFIYKNKALYYKIIIDSGGFIT